MTINTQGKFAVDVSSTAYDAADVPSAFIYKTNNTQERSALTQNTPLKVVAATTLDTSRTNDWTMPANNRITYGGSSDHVADIAIQLSGDNVASGGYYVLRLYKNGSELNSVIYCMDTISSAGFTGDLALVIPDTVSNGDYYEAWVENTLSSTDWDTEVLTIEATFKGWA